MSADKQDSFIGRTFSTPKGGLLTVISKEPRIKRQDIKYRIHCSICSKDTELFPTLFETTKVRLLGSKKQKPNYPCGCTSTKWSESQYKILVEREVLRRGYVFNGWFGSYCRSSTKLDLYNPITTNNWKTTNIDSFLRGRGDPKKADHPRLPDVYFIDRFIKAGFSKQDSFIRDKVKSGVWYLTCHNCVKDEYTQAGVCSGTFSTVGSRLLLGQKPCRCNILNYIWTQDQRRYQIEGVCKEEGLTWVGWSGDYRGGTSKFEWVCAGGHPCKTSVGNFIGKGNRCGKCFNENEQYSYIHLIMEEGSPVGLKYGITSDDKRRTWQQNRRSIFNVIPYKLYRYRLNNECKSAEKECKSIIAEPLFTKEQVPDGFSETCSLDYYNSIVEIYESYGGEEVFTS